ncbi:hypothetical protein DPMN_015572 [Dreissena polymorpha]|uniref:Uncharacterized protein n=1 Tax=Dreissena polymorpha TaxID=45954 RepID=A0A9D4N9E9_DREPO|nr:hypothetical protein DPMN_015572 [Dreissena polymorpha]
MFYYTIRKNAPPLDIASTNLLTKFHKDWTINEASKVLTRNKTIAKHYMSKCQVNWTINVICRVLTRFYYSHIKKNALHLGRHAFQPNGTISNYIRPRYHWDMKNAPPPGYHGFQKSVRHFDSTHHVKPM